MNIPILNMRVAPFVECSRCKALCEFGKQTKCWSCAGDVVITDDSLFSVSVVNTGATYTPYTPYVKCPNCDRLLRVGVTMCPDCREELSIEYSLFSGLTEVLKTIACDNARTIAGFNPFAAIVVLVTAGLTIFSVAAPEEGDFIFFISLLLPFQPLIPLLFILIWFYRFGTIPDNDEDFLYAKRETRRALKLWLLIFAAQLFVVFLLNFPR